ncbi:hypothetical protein AB5I41_04765 [Sphingomonas sp. MMS24-JH45]
MDQTAFVKQIASDARSDSDHLLADELSRALRRPDLGGAGRAQRDAERPDRI